MTICSYQTVTAHGKRGESLCDFTLSIQAGESVAVLGTNGSGKSLLGKLLAREIAVTTGTYHPAVNPKLVSFERITAIIEEDFIEADITEATLLNPGLTMNDLVIRESGVPEIPVDLITRFGLTEKQNTAIRHLSTGEIAKALLISALIASPDLLILDEPFDGLDVASRTEAGSMIDDLIDHGHAVVLILNREEEIPVQCRTVIVMDHQGVLINGPKDTVLRGEPFRRLFHLPKSLPDQLPGELHRRTPVTDEQNRLVTFVDVTISYGDTIVLNRINWSLTPGEHWLISGPNGCGKSTLLSLISGDHPQAYANEITLFGRRRGSGETIWQIKEEIGLVSALLQRDYRVSGSVRDAVLSGFFDSIGLYTKPSPTQRAEADQWLSIAGLRQCADTPFRRLSYGEQRMVLIVRAMVKRPALLILDEPCLGLDPINRQLVLNLVTYIARTGGTTVLYVTHHEEDRIEVIQNRMRFEPAPTGGFTIACSRIGE